MTWCFRIRFAYTPRVRIESGEHEVALPDTHSGRDVRLRSSAPETALREATDVVVIGRPFESEHEARESAAHWRGLLQTAFARVNLPADFGDRAPKSFFTKSGLAMAEAQTGSRVLNDVHGVMAFECEPWPLFAKSSISGLKGVPIERLIDAVSAATNLNAVLSQREQLAYDLYSASFSVPSVDARYAMLMMAVEALIEQEPRSAPARALVARLVTETRATALPQDEIDSMVGTLEGLYEESIGQAGRRLASVLGNRRYMGEPPGRFFSNAYQLRSRLAHGHFPRPTMQDVNERVGALELFVSDLLGHQLLDRVPD